MSAAPLPEELISAYLDGECTGPERAAVEARLTSDAEWRAILDDVRGARDAVRALPVLELPPAFLEHVTERVGERVEVLTTGRARRRWRTALAGGAAAAAVVAGFALASPSAPDDGVAPPIAALADSHGAAASLQTDPVSGLAPLAATAVVP